MSIPVDLIVPCWNNLKFTRETIESFLTRTDPDKTDYRLIFVDNGSSDETPAYLAGLQERAPSRVKVIRNGENKGWVTACNQGFDAIRPNAEWVVFMNNDLLFTDDNWLGRLIGKVQDRPEIGAVGPVSNAVAGRQNTVHNNPKVQGERAAYIIGFCFVARRSALDHLKKIDGYVMDELFSPGGCDELDLCYRLKELGYTAFIDRTVYVHHFCSRSLSKITDDLSAFHAEKTQLLYKKHGETQISQWVDGVLQRVLIGIPTYGQMHHKSVMTLVTLAKPQGVGVEIIARSMPHTARNMLAQQALAHGYDYLFYLDDDMIFNQANLLMKFLDYMKKHPDVDAISPVAHMRSAPFYPCVFMESGDHPYYRLYTEINKGPVQVDATTFAATLVRTSVFRRMKEPWFEFLKVGEETMGEDVSFSYKIKQSGGKIVCDTDEQIWHIGDPLLIGRPTYEQYNKVQPLREILKF